MKLRLDDPSLTTENLFQGKTSDFHIPEPTHVYVSEAMIFTPCRSCLLLSTFRPRAASPRRTRHPKQRREKTQLTWVYTQII